MMASSVTLWLTLLLAHSHAIDVRLDGDFILGGLFPVHSRGDGESCGPVLREKGVQRLEAMLYALDQINSDFGRWRFRLGATLLDTCSSDSHALEQSLQFLNVGCGQNETKRVVGVVGAANSPVSESVANIFRLFKIPQVSYGSTSEELDNNYKFKYFFRVVPSDRFQIQLVLDLLMHFQWTFVSAVAAEGEYGEKALEKLKALALNQTADEICFATTEVLPRNATADHYDAMIDSLLKHEKARAVVVFLNEDKTSQLLSASKRKKVPPYRFQWLGSDGWGAKRSLIQGHERAALGALTILPMRFPITGFDEYFLSLKPSSNSRNQLWFREFWESQFDCEFNRSPFNIQGTKYTKKCTGKEDLRPSYQQEGLVPMVIDAVHVLAHALRALCDADRTLCRHWDGHGGGELLRKHVSGVNFNSSQGNSMTISFDANKSVPVNYTIYQIRSAPKFRSLAMYVPIGRWNPVTRLQLTEKPTWGSKEAGSLSSCSQSCKPGEERVRNLLLHMRCCWTCRACSGEHFLPELGGQCTHCPEGEVPTADRISCEALSPQYMGQRHSSPWSLVPLVFAALGLGATAFVASVFFIYRKTPVIMASGRELCYVILGGVVCCYCLTFIVMSKPTEAKCGLLRVGMGLGLSVCYSAIFTKTNRISRIFNRRLCSVKRPSYISPASQLAICACLVLIQVTLTVMGLIIAPPSVRFETMQHPLPALVLLCGLDGTSVVLGLLYNMLLILMCTVYAFKTRNIPENFNESKYISFTMYSSCIVWLAFICIYCGPWEDYRVQATILCMSVSISGSVTLGCLFLPKIYIVLFKPEKNVRYPSSGNDSASATCATTAGRPVRFLRPTNHHPDAVTLSPSPVMTMPASIEGDRLVPLDPKATKTMI